MKGIVDIALTVLPEVAQLVSAVQILRKKYPQLTPEQITALVTDVTAQSDAAFDDVLNLTKGS